jgi:TPR repeat protein
LKTLSQSKLSTPIFLLYYIVVFKRKQNKKNQTNKALNAISCGGLPTFMGGHQGDANAQYALGFCYANGDGGPQDYAKAIEWYARAAQQGDADDQYELGVFYSNGKGVSKDRAKAVEWLTRAEQQSDAPAHYLLRGCQTNGQEALSCYAKVTEWLSKNANEESDDWFSPESASRQ